MEEWHVGAPVGFGETGQPEIPYMSYVRRKRDDDEEPTEEDCQAELDLDRRRRRCMALSDESWRLYEENRLEEALVLINIALDNLDTRDNDWNRKGIYLDHLGRYAEALECYDKALEIRKDDVVRKNRAGMIIQWVRSEMHSRDELNHGLELLDSAIDSLANCDDENLLNELHELRKEIYNELFFGKTDHVQIIETPEEESAGEGYWHERLSRADFIYGLIDSPETCPKDLRYALMLIDSVIDNLPVSDDLELASRFHELRTRIFKRILIEEKHEYSDVGNMITITGTSFYTSSKFAVDDELELVKEPDNPYDCDAIAVYRNGEKVGYVANACDTAHPNTSHASDVLKRIPDHAHARFMAYVHDYPIAWITDFEDEENQ